jgi:hypothetical protein
MFACNNSSTTVSQTYDGQPDSGIYYAYSPIYTSGYKYGNYQLVKPVTDYWKQFENGDIRTTANIFAEEITLVFPDQVIRGKRDTVLAQAKKLRDSFTVVQSFIYSWMPVITKDSGDDWVFIWGRQEVTDKAGKLKAVEVHEIWQFNKEGKIMFMQQYQTRHA